MKLQNRFCPISELISCNLIHFLIYIRYIRKVYLILKARKNRDFNSSILLNL